MARYNHLPDGEAELLLYGAILSDDLSAKSIATELAALGPIRVLHLRVNSPGGSTAEASAIIAQLNSVRRRGVRMVAHIDGAAYSAASWIVAAVADEVLIAEDALVMLHDASVGVSGRAEDLRRGAAVLDKVSATMRDDYARHLKRRPDEVSALMLAETWWSADEAVAAGFAHRIEEALKLAAAFSPGPRDRSIGALAERYWARRGRVA